MIKLWVDDVRQAPAGYVWIKSVNEAKKEIETREDCEHRLFKRADQCIKNYDMAGSRKCIKEMQNVSIELIDIDHDAGDYASDGGDYIKLLDWLEETGRNYPIHIHSMNPVGRSNMMAIIEKNNWEYVY